MGRPGHTNLPKAHPSGIDSGAALRGYFHAESVAQEFRGPVLQQAKYPAVSTNTNPGRPHMRAGPAGTVTR